MSMYDRVAVKFEGDTVEIFYHPSKPVPAFAQGKINLVKFTGQAQIQWIAETVKKLRDELYDNPNKTYRRVSMELGLMVRSGPLGETIVQDTKDGSIWLGWAGLNQLVGLLEPILAAMNPRQAWLKSLRKGWIFDEEDTDDENLPRYVIIAAGPAKSGGSYYGLYVAGDTYDSLRARISRAIAVEGQRVEEVRDLDTGRVLTFKTETVVHVTILETKIDDLMQLANAEDQMLQLRRLHDDPEYPEYNFEAFRGDEPSCDFARFKTEEEVENYVKKHYPKVWASWAKYKTPTADPAPAPKSTLTMQTIVKQNWVERELDMGTRADGYTLHLTLEDRNAFVQGYHKAWHNAAEAPSEYSTPHGEATLISVPESVVEALRTHKERKDHKYFYKKYGKWLGQLQKPEDLLKEINHE